MYSPIWPFADCTAPHALVCNLPAASCLVSRHAFVMQASKLFKRGQALWSELIPQVLPLFSYNVGQCNQFGTTRPSQTGTSAAEADDSAYWDLVYVLYPEALDSIGQAVLHQQVPSWKMLEAQLLVRTLYQTKLHVCAN